MLCARAASSPAQDRAYPDGLYLGIRLLGESDGAFTLKREQPIASYAFRFGMGPQILYVKKLNDRIGWGVETGGWLFWNKDPDLDALSRPFKHRAVVLPVMANVHVSLLNTRYLRIYLQASGGVAYTQGIHHYDDRSRVEQRTTGIYGLTAVVWIGLFKVPLSDVRTGPRYGFSSFTLNDSPVHSVFFPCWFQR